MGQSAVPILDSAFYLRMMNACTDGEELGVVATLDLTGMLVSSLCSLGPHSLVKSHGSFYIRWSRPRGDRVYCVAVPNDRVHTIWRFLNMRRKTRQHYYLMVKRIGRKAGYGNVVPMTFHHNRCVRCLTVEGHRVDQVPEAIGCSLEVAVRNYALLQAERQALRDHNDERDRTSLWGLGRLLGPSSIHR